MLDTAAFFAAAQRAGMTRAVAWTPSGGGAEQTADAVFREGAAEVVAGEAFAADPTIAYPAAQLTGLKRGETVTVGGVAYKVREDPRPELDGSRMRAALSKV